MPLYSKPYRNMKQIGIWLDFKDCYIVTLAQEGDALVKHLRSDVEHRATKGGSRSKSPWGPQFSPPDKKDLERDKHAEHHYFQQILEHIAADTDEIVIFGPAQAKLGLKKEIESIKHYHPRLRAVLTSDYLSENEMVALVRDFYINPDNYLDNEQES